MSDQQEIWDRMRWVVDEGIGAADQLLPDTPENEAGRQVLLTARQEADRLFYQWLEEGIEP